MIARLQHLLARTLRVYHDHLEEVFEVHVEELDQRLAQFRAGPARPRLEGRNIVLADAQVVCQLALCQALLLAHCPQAGCSNLDIHLGIITRTRIFVKTCLQKSLASARGVQACRPAASTDRIEDTISYPLLEKTARQILEGKPANLLETVAERIAIAILKHRGVIEVTVRVSKRPPLPNLNAFTVEITRPAD